jgi:hypothetical protein
LQSLSRIILGMSAIAALIGAILWFCYWLMRSSLGLSHEFATAVVAATAVLVIPAAIYGGYTGWVQPERFAGSGLSGDGFGLLSL